MNNEQQKEENILVIDFGDGFLSVSLIYFEDGLYEVKAVNGNNNLGGEDFDNRLVDYYIWEFYKKTSIELKNNPKAFNRIRKECEKAKITLSSSNKAFIDIESLIDEEDLYIEIIRDKFEELCLDLFKKFISCIENVIKDAKMSKSQIDQILLVGGSCRIPKIQSLLQELFKGKKLNKSILSDDSVVFGAAIQAAITINENCIMIEKLVLFDVTPFSIGIETEGGVMTTLKFTKYRTRIGTSKNFYSKIIQFIKKQTFKI